MYSGMVLIIVLALCTNETKVFLISLETMLVLVVDLHSTVLRTASLTGMVQFNQARINTG